MSSPESAGRVLRKIAIIESSIASWRYNMSEPMLRHWLGLRGRAAVWQGKRLGRKMDVDALRLRAQKAAARFRGGHAGSVTRLVGAVIAITRKSGTALICENSTSHVAASAIAMLEGRVVGIESAQSRRAALALTVCAMSISDGRVHMISKTNDDAEKLRESFREMYEAIGLSHSLVPLTASRSERYEHYRASVVHVDAVQIATDHLRDRRDGMLNRGRATLLAEYFADGSGQARRFVCGPLHIGLVDDCEALFQESATLPVHLRDASDVISAATIAKSAVEFSARLTKEIDFAPDSSGWLRLTTAGKIRSRMLAFEFGSPWNLEIHRDGTLETALNAIHTFKLHKDYSVIGHAVQLARHVNPEIFSDDSFANVVNILEFKEGLLSKPDQVVVEEYSMRQFFSDYGLLAGIGAPLSGGANEVWDLQKLRSITFGPILPEPRRVSVSKVFATSEEKWREIENLVDWALTNEKPVLIIGAAESNPNALKLNLPASTRDQVVVATDMNVIESWLSEHANNASVLVVVSEAQLLRNRVVSLEKLLARLPKTAKKLVFVDWKEPALANIADGYLIGTLRKIIPRSKRLAASALSRSQRRMDRRAKELRAAKAHWEATTANAFAFTGENIGVNQ